MERKNIEEVIHLWLADKKHYVKLSTYSIYSLMTTNHLIPAFKGISELTEQTVQEFVLCKLSQGHSQKYVKDMLVVLKMILKFGERKGWIAHREMEIKFPTERERVELEVLSIDNQKKIMHYVKENFSFMNLGIYISLCTGLRIGEVCALKWTDIDCIRGVIFIYKTIQRIYITDTNKGHTELVIDTPKSKNSIRQVPIPADLIRTIKKLNKHIDQGGYVLTNSCKPMEPRIYRNYYNKMIQMLNIPKLKFHGLRHSFATRCIESNCDYKTVSVLLGHSNVSTTLNLYVHPNMEQKQRCIDQMFRSLQL